jgi:hypothetical protein
MNPHSYVCFYTRCPNTEFRWLMTSATAVFCDNDDPSFVRAVKDILASEGYLEPKERINADTFMVVNGIDLNPEIDENSETEVFYDFRQWMFATYPEWFGDKRCKICYGEGYVRESHGNPNWWESVVCECCRIENDDFLRSEL